MSQVSSCGPHGRWDKNFASIPCTESCQIPNIDNGIIFCGSTELSKLFHSSGAPKGTECQSICQAGYRVTKKTALKCGSRGTWDSAAGECEETALVILGGEKAGKLVDDVEVFRSNCALPPVPEKVKWGNAGFVEDHILVCGGETEYQNHNLECWALEGGATSWRHVAQLTR